MSKYTTELRYICETEFKLTKSEGYNSIENIIKTVAPKIFNFDFPIFDENYRLPLEIKILKHFYTREISEETVGLWKLRLNTKMNEIMPYYNQLYKSELLEFNPLYTHNLTRQHDIKGTSNSTENSSTKVTHDNTEDVTVNSTNMNLYSDTPQGGLSGLENETYLTNATKDTGIQSTHDTFLGEDDTTGNSTTNGNTTENYLETIVGYEGTDASELLMKYRKTFLNIDMQVIKDLDCLFFQLW